MCPTKYLVLNYVSSGFPKEKKKSLYYLKPLRIRLQYLCLDHARSLVSQVLQGSSNINLFSTCKKENQNNKKLNKKNSPANWVEFKAVITCAASVNLPLLDSLWANSPIENYTVISQQTWQTAPKLAFGDEGGREEKRKAKGRAWMSISYFFKKKYEREILKRCLYSYKEKYIYCKLRTRFLKINL